MKLLILIPLIFQLGFSYPHHIIPLSYDLLFKLPIHEFNGFTGSMVLHFNLSSLSDNITLDAMDLHSFRNISLIRSSDLTEPSLKSIKILKETVEFKFEKSLFPGQYLLTIGEYNGRIGNASEGLFERRHPLLYTTHLQPNHARKLFPCIDHPAVKALFRLSIVHPTDTVAQSNTIAMDVHVENRKWQRTIFQATPLLPAYLVAFSVMPDSNLQLSRQTSFGVTVRVNGESRAIVLRVLDCALASFEILAGLIDVPLPLNKIDFILVQDYDGGMENWGHITVSETLATSGDDAHLIYLIAHEIAHHWIGNRATVDSWNWICLQEDLADWMALKAVKALLTDEIRLQRFQLAQYVEIQLVEDFLSPGHSLFMPSKINQELINRHCYLKGVVLLDTLESVVGEQFMYSVIKSLVASHSTFNLTTFTSYFDQIRVDRNATVGQIYEYWYTTGGYPSILVENNGPSSRLQQLSKPLWPLKMTSTLSIPQFVFSESIVFASESAPLLVNLNFTSFMRVNYDSLTWTAIFKYMFEEPELFSAVGRAQLVSDFCYFHANDGVENGNILKEAVVDMVYSKPEFFELCDWNLYWCHSKSDQSLFSQVVRSLALRFSSATFESTSAFGCKNGMAARNMNQFCEKIFGRKCI
ncbi:Protein CBG19917 [Caenorhabditis briggsae]|uniref:Peptidase_M1 domain-containing protein n=2 Tax=Caenorhabditis briggsae TaxID=6238 RepID=A0AAE9D421_CAEBR|nr:Protein CBG19917 [Caenorhabditis briggsae]ULT94414.1 hypothetical protein L3Y34_003707 [Caenorhabditis briggsae]CAP37077.2 Protein CBG19917 [Caenorhabditis briggsae]